MDSIKKQIQAELQSFYELGTNYYEFLATLDTETCPICGKLDKKVFHITAAEIGKNCPPMHDGCRCTVAPYFDDDFSDEFDKEERAARDPKTGKTVYVPDMSYTEWKNKYLN